MQISLAEHCKELGKYIRELNPHATMMYNPPLDPSINVGYIHGVDCQQLLQHGDAIWSEENNVPEWTSDGRLVSRIRSYKVARTMGQTLFVWQRYTWPYSGESAYANMEERSSLVLRLAESLAYNDANIGVLGNHGVRPDDLSPEAQRYVRFFQSNLQQLVQTIPVADVFVLRSFVSIEFNPSRSNFSTVLFEQTLIQSKIPFGIIFDRHLRNLSKLKVLVLANQDALSDEQIGDIREFVHEGGGLVATENSSLLTEWRTLHDRFGLADVFGIDQPSKELSNKPLQRQFGKGRVVYIPRIEPASALPPAMMNSAIHQELWNLPKNYLDLIEAVKWAAGDKLSATIDAPLWVTMELAEQEASSTRLLHLINFRFQAAIHDIPVRMALPEGFRLREVELKTPDGPGSRTLEASVHKDIVLFKVPRLEVYDLILLHLERS